MMLSSFAKTLGGGYNETNGNTSSPAARPAQNINVINEPPTGSAKRKSAPDEAWHPEAIEHLFPELNESRGTGKTRNSENSVGAFSCAASCKELKPAGAQADNATNLLELMMEAEVDLPSEIQEASSIPCSSSASVPHAQNPANHNMSNPNATPQQLASLRENTACAPSSTHCGASIQKPPAPTHKIPPPAVHCSQFFSLGGDHSRIFEGEGGTGGTNGNAFVFHEAAVQQPENSQTEEVRRPDSECASSSPSLSEVPSNCPSSPPASSADETIRLLLTRRSPSPSSQASGGASGAPCGYAHPAAPPAERLKQTSGAAAATAECPTSRNMLNLNFLSRSGKRQRTGHPPGQNLLEDFPQELDESASEAIAEIIEKSEAWKEIFYYATTEPAAIRIPYQKQL